ncbi:MAG: hypothetical protein DELT_00264 [Desulfovibrio sp.]
MPEEWIPLVLYAVRLPDLDWQPGYIAATPETAPGAIVREHPRAVEFRIIMYGNCKKSLCGKHLGDMLEKWPFSDLDWYYGALEECVLVQGKEPIRSGTAAIPAIISINAPPPKHGWWDLRLTFSPAPVSGEKVWKNAHSSQEAIHCKIQCSDAFDPINDLTGFIDKVKKDVAAQVAIDEEGQYVHMVVWSASHDSIQLRIESLLADEDYCHDFILNKALFVSEWEKALNAFTAAGGW